MERHPSGFEPLVLSLDIADVETKMSDSVIASRPIRLNRPGLEELLPKVVDLMRA